jgi:hypothetical protein
MKKLNKHHIIPKSRGGKSLENNLIEVDIRKHQYYHALFYNQKPEEIVEYLNNYFWKNKYEVSITYKE